MYEDCSVDQATLGHKASWPVGESNTHTGAHTHTRTHTHTHSSGHRTTGRQLHPHASVERTDTRHPLANDLVFFFPFLSPFFFLFIFLLFLLVLPSSSVTPTSLLRRPSNRKCAFAFLQLLQRP